MKLRTVFVLVTLFALGFVATAQKTEPVKPAKLPTAKEVIDQYVKALGGREAIQKIKSRVMSGTVEFVPMNLKGTFEIYAAPEYRTYTKLSIGGIGDMIEGSDDKTSWAVNPIQGSRDRTGTELLQIRQSNNFYRDVKLEQLFPKLEFKGIEKVGDREVYVITAAAEDVPSETWYFDTQTGLMLRSDMTAVTPEGKQQMTTFYEDMRPVDGVLIPFRIRIQTTQFTIVMTSTEVKHNVKIDDAKFAKPKQ
ncbi:MAG: hypothetical protein HOP17_07205 [Acidobacteria bacterium]|nr:hypothetical protein [Acidobacteriota bacterium]